MPGSGLPHRISTWSAGPSSAVTAGPGPTLRFPRALSSVGAAESLGALHDEPGRGEGIHGEIEGVQPPVGADRGGPLTWSRTVPAPWMGIAACWPPASMNTGTGLPSSVAEMFSGSPHRHLPRRRSRARGADGEFAGEADIPVRGLGHAMDRIGQDQQGSRCGFADPGQTLKEPQITLAEDDLSGGLSRS